MGRALRVASGWAPGRASGRVSVRSARVAGLCLALLAAVAGPSAGPSAAQPAGDVAAAARDAARALQQAGVRLSEARGSGDQVRALTETVRAYEEALAAMRDGMRGAALRLRALRDDLDREEAQIASLLGALQSMQTSPEAVALLHPSGPLANARAAMILAEVVPGIEARAADLRGRLDLLRELQALQDGARTVVQDGLDGAERARSDLAAAMANRAVPEGSATDLATMQALVNSADTLDGFAATLTGLGDGPAASAFAALEGALPMPVRGAVLTGYDEADAAGVVRPGWLVAAPPLALVVAPAPATVRYAGPLLDLGQVAILEPEAGWLIVLSGMGRVFARQGEVLEAGAPVGEMGGTRPAPDDILIAADRDGSGQAFTETLYIELRAGDRPVDPATWFAR